MAATLLPESNSVSSSGDVDDMDAVNTDIGRVTIESKNAQRHSDTVNNSKTTENSIQSISNRISEQEMMAANNRIQKCDSQCQQNGKSLMATDELLESNEKACNIKKLNAIDSNRRAGGYLIAVHRKLSRQDSYFLSYHKTRPSLFGVPLLIPCYEHGTNKDLYCAVWVQVARLLSPLPSTPPEQSNHATDW